MNKRTDSIKAVVVGTAILCLIVSAMVIFQKAPKNADNTAVKYSADYVMVDVLRTESTIDGDTILYCLMPDRSVQMYVVYDELAIDTMGACLLMETENDYTTYQVVATR